MEQLRSRAWWQGPCRGLGGQLAARKVGRKKGPLTEPALWEDRPGRQLGQADPVQILASHAGRARTLHSSASSFLMLPPAPQSCPEVRWLIRTGKAPRRAAGRPVWGPSPPCLARPDTGWTDRPSGPSHELRPLPLLEDPRLRLPVA